MNQRVTLAVHIIDETFEVNLKPTRLTRRKDLEEARELLDQAYKDAKRWLESRQAPSIVEE